MNHYKTMEYILSVIQSCTTADQLNNAYIWARTVARRNAVDSNSDRINFLSTLKISYECEEVKKRIIKLEEDKKENLTLDQLSIL